MSLSQNLNEFRFNLETLDLLTSMGKSTTTLNELINQELVQFMVSNRTLLSSVLLRLQLYSEQNLIESKVRNSMSVLNNKYVNLLLNHLYPSKVENKPVENKQVKQLAEVIEVDENEEVIEEEEVNHFDSFFNKHIQQSEEPTDILKFSAVYDTFKTWWSFNDEVSSKDELKDYLSEKLNCKIKQTISNVLFK